MKNRTSFIFSMFVLASGISYHGQTAAQSNVTTSTSSLITYLAKEANQPDLHSAGDQYLRVSIGKTAYIAELETGKVVGETNAGISSGGTCGDYTEVHVNLLDKDQQETSQGASQILKLKNGKWKRVALSEGDYACDKLKGIPQAVLYCMKIECN